MKNVLLSLGLGIMLSVVPIAIYAGDCCDPTLKIGKSTCTLISEDCSDPSVGVCVYGNCDPPLDT